MKIPYDTIAGMIDISCVKSSNTRRDIDLMVAMAVQYKFVCAFALPAFTPYLIEKLKGSETMVGGTVAFPAGCSTTAAKAFEARELVNMGCDELDMVINIGKLKSGSVKAVRDDIEAVVHAAQGKPVKAILEVSLLTDDEIIGACEAAADAGAAYIKTGTGWMKEPATVADIELIRRTVGDRVHVKAAGGIRNLETLLAMKEAGCDRFGLSLRPAAAVMRQAGAPGSNGL